RAGDHGFHVATNGRIGKRNVEPLHTRAKNDTHAAAQSQRKTPPRLRRRGSGLCIVFSGGGTESLQWGALKAGGFLGLTLPAFLKQRPDLADLGPHGLAYLDALARPQPVLEIAIASAARATGAFCSAVHSAPCTTSYRCLFASVTGSRPCTTAASFRPIIAPSFNVGLTY